MNSDRPQDAPHPQEPQRGEHVEVVEQAMDAEPAPARISRRTRLRRAVSARRPTRALPRSAALVAAGLIAGILLTLGVGALAMDPGDRSARPGAGAADGRGGHGHGDRDRDRPGDDSGDDDSSDEGTATADTPG